MRFDEILTNDDVLDGLWDMHFDECTPIQEQAIPIIMEGNDLLACAQTGTGKTAAYLLPVINMLADGGYPEDAINCVVMAPTRELAQQIDRQLQGFAYFMPVSGMAIYGGTDGHTYDQQRKSLKMGADVVIATPGRLLAHLNMGYVDLSKVSFFILDEADRMLDMGFYDDIMQIVSKLPKERQTLLFSATMPPKIQQMANKILHNPAEIKLAVSKPAEKIKQSAYISKRDDVILDFKAGKIQVIVATDILARGIDIDDIEMVVNYDVPREAEDYVHRIGRTARADRDGRAVTFVSPEEFSKLKRIERLLEKDIPKEEVPDELGGAPRMSRESNIRNGKTRHFRKASGQSQNKRNNRRRNGSKDRNRSSNEQAQQTVPV